jgi:hypothetical protein
VVWQQNPPIHGFGTKAVHGARVLKDELGAQREILGNPHSLLRSSGICTLFPACAGALFVLLAGAVLLG